MKPFDREKKKIVSPMYQQCRIEDNGNSLVIYIPEELAKKGNMFKYTKKGPKDKIFHHIVYVMEVSGPKYILPKKTLIDRGIKFFSEKIIEEE